MDTNQSNQSDQTNQVKVKITQDTIKKDICWYGTVQPRTVTIFNNKKQKHEKTNLKFTQICIIISFISNFWPAKLKSNGNQNIIS